MRILLIGDSSHYHASLAEALRREGHCVTLASSGSGWMNTPRDIDISRPFRGKTGGALLYFKLRSLLNSHLRGYDVVQIAGPLFLQLLPHRNLDIFRRLKRGNGKIFVCALATDTPYIDFCVSEKSKLAYNEWRLGDAPSQYALSREGREVERIWHTDALSGLCRDVYCEANGVLSALYEYHLAIESAFPDVPLAYAGIPVDTETLSKMRHPRASGEINIFLGRHSSRIVEKGSDLLESAARRAIASASRPATLTIVEDLPYHNYLDAISQADIVLDQAYSYSPATNALIAAAMGIPVVSGGEPDFYRFIRESFLHPVINIDPENIDGLVDKLRHLIDSPEERTRIGSDSRDFVKKHNSLEAVARRTLSFYGQS